MLKSQQLTRHSGISAETVDNPRLRGTELLEQPCNDVVGTHTVKHQRLVQLFGKAGMEQRKLYLRSFVEPRGALRGSPTMGASQRSRKVRQRA